MNRLNIQRILLVILLVGAVFVLGDVAYAQLSSTELGAAQFDDSGLTGGGNLTLIVARIIRGFIGLLGVVAIGFVVYGGWMWMTAGGDEGKVDKAKQVIINGTIGMAIILSSFAIASFVINALVTGVTGSTGSGGGGGGGGGGYGGGFGSGAEVTVQYPGSTKAGFVDEFTLFFFKDFGKPAYINSQTLKKGDTITMYQVVDGVDQEIDFDFEVVSNTVLLKVKEVGAFSCPSNSKGLTHCFPNDGTFRLVLEGGGAIGGGIYDNDNDPLTCSKAFPCDGRWKIGSVDDATAPTGAIFTLTEQGGSVYYTGSSISVDSFFSGEGDAIDDLEVQKVVLYDDGVEFMQIPGEVNTEGYYTSDIQFSFPYDTNGMTVLKQHDIDLDVVDTSNNEGQGNKFRYSTAAAHCFNNVMDEDEVGVDCGGSSCPKCSSEQCVAPPEQCDTSCNDDVECESGVCGENGQCIVSPVITGVFLGNGAPGNYVQIVGEGFGVRGVDSKVVFASGNVSAEASFAQCPGGDVSWTDEQIIVEVPNVAQGQYAITVTAQSGLFDTTDNDLLPELPDFVVNDTVRPGIACVKPDGLVGEPLLVGSSITVHGKNFGATQDQGSKVTVGSIAVAPKPSNSWSNTSVQTIVPSITDGKRTVLIERGSTNSNPYDILISGIDEDSLPIIGSVHPSTAKPGDMITIIGTGFGENPNTVFFGEDGVLADTDFPEQCSAFDPWSSSQIVVKVPESLDAGNQPIVVNRLSPAVATEPFDYIIEDGESSPNLCSIVPNNGPVGTVVTLGGESFGSSGTVVFGGRQANMTTAAWSKDEIAGLAVPSDALSGDVTISNTNGKSNPLQYIVNDCTQNGCLEAGQTCCTVGTAIGSCVPDGDTCPGVVENLTAAYEWIFSTGIAPTVPRLLRQCSEGVTPSPSPSDERSGGGSVCVNAKVVGAFNVAISPLVYGTDIVIERCVDVTQEQADEYNAKVEDEADMIQPAICAYTEVIPSGELTIDLTHDEGVFEIGHVSGFDAASTYKVTLFTSIVSDPPEGDPIGMVPDGLCKSVEGAEGVPADCFSFTTEESGDVCAVETVKVSPSYYSTDEFGLVMDTNDDGIFDPVVWDALGLGVDQCVVLDSDPNGWSWSTAGDYMSAASVGQLSGDDAYRAHVTAIDGIPSSEYVEITATYTNHDQTKVSGFGQLKITDENPGIVSVSPQCNKACKNTPVIVEFDSMVDAQTYRSNIAVHRCFDESCNILAGKVAGELEREGVQKIAKADGTSVYGFSELIWYPFKGDIEPGTWYRVIIQGGDNGVKSVSGLPITGLNNGDTYTWKFRTRDENDVCEIKSVEVKPIKGVVKAAGEQVVYTAVPRSEGDECNADGQVLSAWDYDWHWSMSYAGSVGLLVGGGEVDVGQTQPWCSADGFKSGSQPNVAVCGDNIENEKFEECDDGNIVDGDGCSSRCLREGVVSVFDVNGDGVPDSGTCGNAVSADPTYESAQVNPGVEKNVGEECDDGNMEGGDGCSITCLNEGSSFGGSVCGNGDVGPGEDCDDGNSTPGDGCSGECLFEGSPPLLVECGNLTANSEPSLFEKCSDGVLWAACGNNIVEPAEGCDDGNVESGDGCSSNCLQEYKSDKIPEDKDNKNLCTPHLEYDGKVDPVQTVEAVGIGAVNVSDEQLAEVKASVKQGNDYPERYGEAEFALQCGYVLNSNCAALIPGLDNEDYGVASNSCCLARPKLVSQFPAGANACLNSIVYLDVDQPISAATLADNVHLYDNTCAAGVPTVDIELGAAEMIDAPWYARLWHAVRRISFAVSGSLVYAQDGSGEPDPVEIVSFCESGIDGKVSVVPVPAIGDGVLSGGYRIMFQIDEMLEPATKYMLVVDGGVDGVRGSNGVALYGGQVHIGDWFETADTNEECELNEIRLDKEVVVIGDLQQSQAVHVAAYTKNDVMITQIPGVYDWSYKWELVDVEPGEAVSMLGSSQTSRTLSAGAKNGSATLIATAQITVYDGGDIGDTFDDSATVDVFVCENKWPPNLSEGFSDFEGYYYHTLDYNNRIGQVFGNGFDLGPIRTNFKTKYCRDRGAMGYQSDDLPALRPLVISAPPNPATTLKEFFFQPDVLGNKDVIGLRIEKNLMHAPIEEWYAARGFKGSPQKTSVNGFPALQDGRTLYISGANASVFGLDRFEGINNLRTNVYVFSYNQGASADTLAIYQQMIQNFELLANVRDFGNVCYYDEQGSGIQGLKETSENYVEGEEGTISCVSDYDCRLVASVPGAVARCAGLKGKISRDLKRLDDLLTIDGEIGDYYAEHFSYPMMSIGTFVPGRSASTWSSWQSTLGNNLSTALPVDPVNKLVCGDDEAEESTCWNQEAQEFSCMPGSLAYQYVMGVGGQEYELRAQFEMPLSIWTDYSINESHWKTSNMCDGTVYSAAAVGVCGNGVVEVNEQCDPPGVEKVEQVNAGDGNIEYITYACMNSCVWQIQGSVTSSACGNGVIDLDFNETCDDGSLNGQYGYCNESCTSDLVCGDGVIQSVPEGPEICEIKDVYGCENNTFRSCEDNVDCVYESFVDEIEAEAGVPDGCAVIHVLEWVQQPDGSLVRLPRWKYDCGACVVTAADGYAEDELDSCNWDCRELGPYCGDGVVQSLHEECDGQAGLPEPFDGHPSCADGQKYQLSCNSSCQIQGGSCLAMSIAGDFDPQEPVVPTCGDGNEDPAEECDAGDQNAYSCIASYANPPQTCTFCHADSCRVKAQTGGFCGDGVVNGGEECDADDVKGGALQACLNLGFDYGIPQCNLACTGYGENGCQYCGRIASDGSGVFDVQGVVIDPRAIDPDDRIVEAVDVSVYHEDDLAQSPLSAKTVQSNAAGVYGLYLADDTLADGSFACQEYQIKVENQGVGQFYAMTPKFVGDGTKRFFKHYYFNEIEDGYEYFLVEWSGVEDVDFKLSFNPDGSSMKEVSKAKYIDAFTTNGLDVAAQLFYDTQTEDVGYELIGVYGLDGYAVDNKPTTYLFSVMHNTMDPIPFGGGNAEIKVYRFNQSGVSIYTIPADPQTHTWYIHFESDADGQLQYMADYMLDPTQLLSGGISGDPTGGLGGISMDECLDAGNSQSDCDDLVAKNTDYSGGAGASYQQPFKFGFSP